MFKVKIAFLSGVGLLTRTIFFFLALSSIAPDKAPTILSVTPHTTTSVLVRWQVRCRITWRCVLNELGKWRLLSRALDRVECLLRIEHLADLFSP